MPATSASGASSANVSASKTPSSAGSSARSGFVKIPIEPLFSGIGHILFLASIVVVVGISIIFLGIPNLQKRISTGSQSHKVGPFVPPINVAYINFPSDFQRDIFLKNFQDAGKTTDPGQRYKLLQDDYTRLLGFYAGDHSEKTRKILEQYAQYMINNYPQHAQESIYTVPCFDSGCGTAKYPDEIKKIKGEVEGSEAINRDVKEGILKQLEVAAFSSDKNTQFVTYLNVLSVLKSEYDRTKDNGIKNIYGDLQAFMKKAYPEWGIPPQTRI